MDPSLQPAQTELDNRSQTIATQQQNIATQQQTIQQQQNEIDSLQAQIAAASNVVLTDVQLAMPDQTLWYEARSANAPKTGPHGTVNITPGKVCTADFHPVVLTGGFSDNCYNLYRKYPSLTPLQKAVLESATKMSVGYTIDSISPVANMQAVELDYQIRKSTGVVINVGLQLLPDGTLRVFDFVNKNWVAVGTKISMSGGPTSLKLNATCDNKNVTFTSVTVNGVDEAISAGHPVSMSSANSPYFNMAYQLDGRPDAKSYILTFEKFTASFAL